MALVKNISGSSKYNPPSGYGSWKEYWEARKYRRFSYCACITCQNRAEVGGHVKMVYGPNDWYIIPICSFHNNPSFVEPYTVRDDDLLPVNLY